nr:endo-1,4-beta-xylanase [Lachnospiraceae bacterium]
MKRLLALLLAAVMVLSVAGCKKGNDTKQTSEPTQAVTQAAEPTKAPTEAPTATPEPEPTKEPINPDDYCLKDVFAQHGMKIGTCISGNMIDRPAISKIITENFSSLTCENAMKPDYIFNRNKSKETGDLVVEFNSEALKIMDYAKENGLSMRGHTLVWYSQTPNWIFKEGFENSGDFVDRDTMLARMESYIKQVFEQLEALGYIDLFYAYDVVNEAWMEDGTIRQNNWTKIIGDDYLWYAFYFADKYAPESIDLYYNDYNEQM